MKHVLLSLAAVIVLVLAGLHVAKPTIFVNPTPVTVAQPIGGSVSQDHYAPEFFVSVNSEITKSSTTTPAAMDAASSGFFSIPSGSTVFNASTTAIASNGAILDINPVASATQASLMTKLGSTLCNTAPASSTIHTIFASSSPTANGFSVTITGASSRPFCYNWRILDGNK